MRGEYSLFSILNDKAATLTKIQFKIKDKELLSRLNGA